VVSMVVVVFLFLVFLFSDFLVFSESFFVVLIGFVVKPSCNPSVLSLL
jgi:hypothetical protein